MSDGDLARLLERGIAQQRAGQHRAAIQILRQVLRRGGPSAALLLRLGKSYRQIGDAQRADEAYVEAIRVDPDCTEAYLRAAELARRAGALAAEAGQAGPARELRRGAFQYLVSLGYRLVQRAAWREAETAFRAALPLEPQDWAAHVDLGRCLYEQGRDEAAEAAIRAGLALAPAQARAPDQALAHRQLALVLRRRGDDAEADAAERRAVALDPP